MNLAARKRLLIARSDLHREILGLEYLRLHQRWAGAVAQPAKRWSWLVGGAFAGGLLLMGKGKGLARWVPTLLTLWRTFKG